MLPEGLGVEIEKGTWPVLPIFDLLQKEGNLVEDEMYNIFNMGIGMVVVVSSEEAEEAVKYFEELGEKAYAIGSIVADQGVHWRN